MIKRAEQKIERIMGAAFKQAAGVLDEEVRKLLRARSDRYSRFVLAVGWGPTLFDVHGKIVEESDDRCCAKAKRLLQFADEFYDRYGGDNHQVIA